MDVTKDFSKRNMSLIPRKQIEWLVGGLHVSVSDAEVEAFIRKRALKTASERLIKMCVTHALKCHHKNQKLYRAVMTGRF